jgi:hypothetical protein
MSPSSTPAPATSAGVKPGPFAVSALIIYVLSFMSQMLLSAPVVSRLTVGPFVVAQAVLIGLWVVLHRRRLNDAGRPWGTVIGIAVVYALEIALLVLLAVFIGSLNTTGSDGASGSDMLLSLFVIFTLLALFSDGGLVVALQLWLLGFLAVMLLPVVIAVCFSIWAATRPSQAQAVS